MDWAIRCGEPKDEKNNSGGKQGYDCPNSGKPGAGGFKEKRATMPFTPRGENRRRSI